MTIAEQSIEVETSANAAYAQWARFEELPRFMEGVSEVERVGRSELKWVADLCGKRLRWSAEITEETPGKRIAWESKGGRFNSGDVRFTKLAVDRTRVDFHVEYDPHDLADALIAEVGPDQRQLHGDLECFKELVEDSVPS